MRSVKGYRAVVLLYRRRVHAVHKMQAGLQFHILRCVRTYLVCQVVRVERNDSFVTHHCAGIRPIYKVQAVCQFYILRTRSVRFVAQVVRAHRVNRMAVRCRCRIRCYRYVCAGLHFRLGRRYISLRRKAADRYLIRISGIHLVLYDQGHGSVICHLIRFVCRRCILDQTVIRRRSAQIAQADRLGLTIVPAEGYRLGCCIFCYRGVGVLQTGYCSRTSVFMGQRNRTFGRLTVRAIIRHAVFHMHILHGYIIRSSHAIGRRRNRNVRIASLCLYHALIGVNLHYAVSCYFCRCVRTIDKVQAVRQLYTLRRRFVCTICFVCQIIYINRVSVVPINICRRNFMDISYIITLCNSRTSFL